MSRRRASSSIRSPAAGSPIESATRVARSLERIADRAQRECARRHDGRAARRAARAATSCGARRRAARGRPRSARVHRRRPTTRARSTPGSVFVALRGLKADGVEFAPQAIARGAAADRFRAPAPHDADVPWVDRRATRGWRSRCLAAEFYRPSEPADAVVGITGTNGKTTTGYLVSAIFEAAGIQCGLMGTVDLPHRRPGAARRRGRRPRLRTCRRSCARWSIGGCGACVMEVSSHALALRRVDGIRFAAGVFTNLTRDHLDFHADMEDYFAAKRRLFEMLPRDAPAVINIDDPRGASLVEIVGASGHVRASTKPAEVAPGPLSYLARRPAVRRAHAAGRRCTCVRSWSAGRTSTTSSRPSRRRRALDVPLEAIEQGLARCRRSRPIRGRLERPTTTSRWSWTTRTPTTRCGICSRRRGRWRCGA